MVSLIQKVIRFNIDLAKLFALNFIRGISQKDVCEAAKVYSRYLLESMKSKKNSILELLKNCKRNYKVFIISRTLDPLKLIGQMLGVQMISSRIKYVDLKVKSLECDIDKKMVIEKLAKLYQLSPLLIVSDDKEDMLEVFPIKVLVKNSCGLPCNLFIYRFLGIEALRYELEGIK